MNPANISRRAALGLGAFALGGCAPTLTPQATAPPATSPPPSPVASVTPSPSPASPSVPARAEIVAEFAGQASTAFGLDLPGVVQRTSQDAVCLTFDACGGEGGSQVDEELLAVLEATSTPATLFINARFIDANLARVKELAANPLFQIANHGTRHLPLSVVGAAAYGISGTADVGEVYDEVCINHLRLAELLGAPSPFFRSGTAHVDDVSVRICQRLGISVVNFDINSDGGATFTAAQVRDAVLAARAGSICIGHFNRPGSGTAAGIREAIPALRDRGLTFSASLEG